MEYFQDERNSRGKTWGAVAALLYAAVWIALLLLVNFSLGRQNEFGEGIMVDFGNSDSGFGETDTRLADEIARRSASGGSPGDLEEILTQEHEDAPEVRQQPQATPPQRQNNQPAQQQRTNTSDAQPAAEAPREANPRALFPGRTEGSQAVSQGTAGGEGNQGNPAGSPGGDPAGTGTGASGNAFDLSGRNLIGSLPVPAYNGNNSGRVIMTIIVDRSGSVTGATYRAQGSTTNDAQLVNAARTAALRAKFSPSEVADVQTGTITYNFRLR